MTNYSSYRSSKWVQDNNLAAGLNYAKNRYSNTPVEEAPMFDANKRPFGATCPAGNEDCDYESLGNIDFQKVTQILPRHMSRTGLMVTNGTYPVDISFMDPSNGSSRYAHKRVTVCEKHLEMLMGVEDVINPFDSIESMVHHEEYLSQRTFL